MGYNEKNKSQLLSENEILRKRILELEETQRNNEFLERALLDSEQRYRDLYENAPLGYQSLDENGNISEVNDAWCNTFGYQRVEIIGMNFSGFLTMESNKKFKQKFPELIKTGNAHSVEFELIRKDGLHIIVSLDGRAAYDIHGKFKQSHCILHDITERKRAEKALFESERRLKKAQDMSKVGDYEWILDTNKITWSDGLYKIFGFPVGSKLTYELLSRHIHPDDREYNTKIMNKWLKEGGGEPYEYRIIRADGSIRYIYEDCEIIYNDERKVEKLFGVVHDITERKLAEEELKKSEETLRKVMKASGDYIMMLDREHKIQYVNRTEQGIDAKTIVGIPLYKLVDKVDQQRVKKHLNEVINKNVRREYETVYHRSDGTDIFYYSVAVPLLSDGKVTGTVINSRDITERKLAEEILREQEAMFRTLFNASTDTIAIISRDGKIMNINEKGAKRLGYRPEKIIGRNIFKMFPPGLAKIRRSYSNIVFNMGKPVEYEDERKDMSFLNRAYPIFNKDGKVISAAVFALDITERKHLEIILSEREKKLESIFRAAPVGIGLVSNRVLLDVNDRLCEITGFSKKELIGKNARVLYPTKKDYDYVGSEKYKQIKKKGTGTVETRFKRKDGKIIDVILSSTPLNPNDLKEGVTFTALDITERKKIEEKISEWKNRYESAVASSGHILYDWDSVTNEVTYGGKIKNILGYSTNEMEGGLSRWIELIHSDDKHYFKKKIEYLISTKNPAKLEYRVQRKDGKYIYVEDEGQFIKQSQNKITRMIGFVKDITERKRLEEERERLFYDRGERIKELKCLHDISDSISKHVDLGKIFQDTVGSMPVAWQYPDITRCKIKYDGKEFVSKPFKESIWKQTSKITVKGKVHGTVEVYYIEKCTKMDEGPFSKDERALINSIAQNLSQAAERILALGDLEKAEENYRSIFENAVEGIYQTTPDGKFISANPALAKMLGYKTSKELLEKVIDVEEQLYVDPKERDEFKKLINKQSIVRNYEIQLYRKDRKKIWVSLSSRAVRDSKRKLKLYEGTFEDITERKKVEDEIRNSREQLRNLSSNLQSIREEERGVIAREIHDDLGQSLTALKMDVSWLKKNFHTNKDKIQTKINGMNFLISETIRSVQRISSELRPGLLDDLGLSSAIQWYANEFINRTGIKCIVTIDPKEIKLEEKLSIAIYRIFQESLTNVIRHANATKVNVSFTLKKNNLNLVVKDNGIGIQNDLINDSKSLGLIGMQERVYPWNGTVTISGSKGKGTTVNVKLSLKK